MLGDRGVDHPLVAEFLQQTARDLVGPLVLAHLLAHQEYAGVGPHFLRHGVSQGVADGGFGEDSSGREIWFGRRRRGFGQLLFGVAGLLAPLPLEGRGWGWGPGLGGGSRRSRRCLGLIGAAPLSQPSPPRGGRGLRATQTRDRRPHLDVLRPRLDQQGLDRALVDGLDLHGRLVGLDLGDHIARAHGVAHLDQPFGEPALLHGG